MTQIYRCRHGHEWEDAFGGASQLPGQVMVCPVCGATIEMAPVPLPARGTVATTAGELSSAAPDPASSGTCDLRFGAAEPLLPSSVAGYEILSELGRGGMGVVYKARQVRLNRLVALKMVLAGAHAGSSGLARFRTEAEAVARLQHPHIVQIHEIGEQDDLPYFSMEFVDGGSLASRAAGKPQPASWAAQVVEQLARAMDAAHQRGIIHRDLKPANVLLTADGQPKITDFGLAKQLDTTGSQTRTGDIMGTPSYMSPEQAEGRTKEIGPAADIYALGAILYELLTGRPPFEGESPIDTLLQVLHTEPVPPLRLQPRIARDLDTICLKCLEKEPRKRYPTAAALADDLHRFLNNEPIRARPITLTDRLVKWARRRPVVAALWGFIGLLGLSLIGVSVYANFALKAAADRERDRAQEAQEQRQRAEANAQQAQANEIEANDQRRRAESNAREADQQRRQAEANLRKARDAVDQMLTVVGKDLLDDVPGIDQQKREALLRQAIAFYRSFLQQKYTDPEMRRETGLVYYHLGTLLRGLRQHVEARHAYELAIALQKELADSSAGEAQHRQELANSYNYLGETLRTQGQDLDGAAQAYQQAIDLQEALAKLDRREPAYRLELARSHYNRGILRMDSGEHLAAEDDYDRAIELLQEAIALLRQRPLPPNEPDYRQGLARSFINRGILLKETQRQPAAEKDYAQAIDLLRQLHKEVPAKSDYRYELAVSLINHGNLLSLHPERRSQSVKEFREARPLLERLAEEFPQKPRYRQELANCLNSLAGVLWVPGQKTNLQSQLDEAAALYQETLKLQRQLVKEAPQTPDYHNALAGTLDNLAVLLRDQDQLAEARKLLDEALLHHHQAIRANPRHRLYSQFLRKHYVFVAETALKQRDHEAIAAAMTEMVQVGADDWQRYLRAAGFLARCVPLAEQDPNLTAAKQKELSQSYADRAMKLLRQAVDKGFVDSSLLRPAAFDVLRKRDDFKELVQELETKK